MALVKINTQRSAIAWPKVCRHGTTHGTAYTPEVLLRFGRDGGGGPNPQWHSFFQPIPLGSDPKGESIRCRRPSNAILRGGFRSLTGLRFESERKFDVDGIPDNHEPISDQRPVEQKQHGSGFASDAVSVKPNSLTQSPPPPLALTPCNRYPVYAPLNAPPFWFVGDSSPIQH